MRHQQKSIFMQNIKKITTAIALLLAMPISAFAHHPLGGKMVYTFQDGLLSGIGHPILGFDHLSFILMIAILSLLTQNRTIVLTTYIGVMLLGVVFGAQLMPAIDIASMINVEVIVILSILITALILLQAKQVTTPVLASIIAFFGMFHGVALGESVIGAEPTPIIAYFLGLALCQYAIIYGVGYGFKTLYFGRDVLTEKIKVTAAVFVGIGLTYNVELIEGFIF